MLSTSDEGCSVFKLEMQNKMQMSSAWSPDRQEVVNWLSKIMKTSGTRQMNGH